MSELLVFALDFYRSPLRYRQLTEPMHPLPRAFDILLPDLAASIAPQNIETTARRLGHNPAEIERAALFLIRQVLFTPGADHYRTLGLSQEASESTIRQHYQLLIRLFHPDRSSGDKELDAAYTVRLNDAYSTLRDSGSRKRYDEQLTTLGRSLEPLPESLAFKPSDPFDMDHLPKESGWDAQGFWRSRRPGMRIAVSTISIFTLVLCLLVAARFFDRMSFPTLSEVLDNLPIRESDTPTIGGIPSDISSIPQTKKLGQPTNTEAKPVTQTSQAPLSAKHTTNQDDLGTPTPLTTIQQFSSIPSATTGQPLTSRDQAIQNSRTSSQSRPEINAEQAALANNEPALSEPYPIAGTPHNSPASVTDAPTTVATNGSKLGNNIDRPQQFSPSTPPITPHRPDITAVESKAAEKPKQPKLSLHDTPQTAAMPRLMNKDGDNVAKRFAMAYRTGDLDVLTGLFTENARVNEGHGRSFIRKDYAAFFKRVPERTLELAPGSWQTNPDGGLSGQFRAIVQTRTKGARNWQSLGGTIEFELVQTKEGPRIIRMLHRLERILDADRDTSAIHETKIASENGHLHTNTTSKATTSARQADKIIEALARAYEQGDVSAFVALFAADARVNGGQGVDFISQDYSRFFTQFPERHIRIIAPDWQLRDSGKLIGTARASAAVRQKDAVEWHFLEGALNFELIKGPQGLEISQMLDSLK